MSLMLSDKAFEMLFREHFAYLFNVVNKMIDDRSAAEDIVQEVFVKLWNRRGQLKIETSPRAYLTRSVINATLNYLEKNRTWLTRSDIDEHQELSGGSSTDDPFLHDELRQKINQTIKALPPKCQLVFTLSRFEGLSNQEIADHLGITKKTVENQMGKALQKLRESLSNYLDLLELSGVLLGMLVAVLTAF